MDNGIVLFRSLLHLCAILRIFRYHIRYKIALPKINETIETIIPLMTLNCKGTLIDLQVPKVMGILNITPDSFYDGGKLKNPEITLKHAEKLLLEGATFLDVGGYSSRPGATDISEDEELHRVLPTINLILNEFPEAILSIDTFRSRVAKKCLQVGAAMINDISGGHLDPEMLQTVAKFKAPYIAMHMRGTPQSMIDLTDYEDLILEMRTYFSELLGKTQELQLSDVILDPGFGFAKDTAQNFEVLQNLDLFKMLNKPLLIGLSRKSMIYKTLKNTAQEALNGTTALHMIALERGAHILRVHDVKEAVECIQLHTALHASN